MIYEFLNIEHGFAYALLISIGDVKLRGHATFNNFILNWALIFHVLYQR